MEEISEILPFDSYDDMINSLKNGKATLKIMRSDCSQIAGIKHPVFSSLGMYMAFFITLIALIFLSITLRNYWLLILIPINFILNLIIVYIPKIKTISYFLLFASIFITNFPIWILITCLDIICMYFFYNIWWNIIYSQALQELQYNQEAFVWSWNRCGINIEDCYGNNYNKLTINNKTSNIEAKYVQLSNIVMKALDVFNVEDALLQTYQFYIENEIDLSSINLNGDNQYETLSNILMIAMDTDNIDDTIDKTVSFYKEQGIEI